MRDTLYALLLVPVFYVLLVLLFAMVGCSGSPMQPTAQPEAPAPAATTDVLLTDPTLGCHTLEPVPANVFTCR